MPQGSRSVREILRDTHDAVIIGSGFGASVAITMLAEQGYKVLVLERGTWWKNPEGPALRDQGDKPKYEILGKYQFWPRPNDAKGLNYIAESIYKEVHGAWDLLNPFIKDRDLGLKRNRKGLYRVTRFEHKNGNVDIVSGSGVGGGSLFYSGVNLVPHDDVMQRIGLNHLSHDDFDAAGRWMLNYRGRINKVVTTAPTPHRSGTKSHFQERLDTPLIPEYEMPDPELPEHEAYLEVPRSRTLRRAFCDAQKDLKAIGVDVDRPKYKSKSEWHPLPLSIVEMDSNPWTKGDEAPHASADCTTLTHALDDTETTIRLADASVLDLTESLDQEISLLVACNGDQGPYEIMTVREKVDCAKPNEVQVERATWHSNPHPHSKDAKVWRLYRGESDRKNSFCLRESRCTLGCLPSARHTLYKTIQNLSLRLDKRREDECSKPVKDRKPVGSIDVLPLSKVSHVTAAKGGGYEVHFEMFLKGSEGWKKKAAPHVFFGAGVLGTVEILLRSKREGLPLTDSLGDGFSTNGDIFGFATKVDRFDKNGKPKSSSKRQKVNATVGPINASGVNLHFKKDQIHVNLEDTGVPPTFAQFIDAIMPGLHRWDVVFELARAAFRTLALGTDPFDTAGKPDPEEQEPREYMTQRELLSDFFFFTGMGAGPGEPLGRFQLDDDDSGLKLSYPNGQKLHNWDVFTKAIETMKLLSTHMNTRPKDFTLSPLWKNKKRVTVVHPLGGCCLGTDRRTGTCDVTGRLFDAAAPDDYTTLPGLFVVDASAIPGALGVNPTLTIVTQAIKSVEQAMVDMGPPTGVTG